MERGNILLKSIKYLKMEKLHPDLRKPLPDIEMEVYNCFLSKAKQLKIKSSSTKEFVQILPTEDKQNLVANYAYVIYEYLELNKVRKGVDYTMVKRFANAYKRWLNYIFIENPVQHKLSVWLRDPSSLTEMSIYKPTNKYNKNIYH